MNEVRKSIDDMIKAVLNCDAYKRYNDTKEKLKDHPEKEKRIHNLRKNNYLIQNNTEGLDVFAEVDRLEKEYADVYRDPLMSEFLSSEVAICRLIQQINKDLITAIDFDAVLDDEQDSL